MSYIDVSIHKVHDIVLRIHVIHVYASDMRVHVCILPEEPAIDNSIHLLMPAC